MVFYIYCLSNELYKDFYKVGYTKGSLCKRIKDLNSTGVLGELKLEFYIKNEKINYEKIIHNRLKELNFEKHKEFFKCSIVDVKNIFSEYGEIFTEEKLIEKSSTPNPKKFSKVKKHKIITSEIPVVNSDENNNQLIDSCSNINILKNKSDGLYFEILNQLVKPFYDYDELKWESIRDTKSSFTDLYKMSDIVNAKFQITGINVNTKSKLLNIEESFKGNTTFYITKSSNYSTNRLWEIKIEKFIKDLKNWEEYNKSLITFEKTNTENDSEIKLLKEMLINKDNELEKIKSELNTFKSAIKDLMKKYIDIS